MKSTENILTTALFGFLGTSHKGVDEWIQCQCVIQCFVRDEISWAVGRAREVGESYARSTSSDAGWLWMERYHTLIMVLVDYAVCAVESIEYLPFVSPGTFISGQTAPAPSELHALVGSSSSFQTKGRKELSISTVTCISTDHRNTPVSNYRQRPTGHLLISISLLQSIKPYTLFIFRSQ